MRRFDLNVGYSIYGLWCPLDKKFRYIGFTTKFLKYRLWKHVNQAINSYGNNPHKNNWIKSLLDKNLKPEIYLIKESNKSTWESDEQFYIDHYRRIGCDLVNIVGGGKSGLNRKHSEETKQKQRSASLGNKNWLGKKHSEETKRLLSSIHLGKIVSDQTRKKLSGKIVSEETKRKISSTKRNKKLVL